MLIGRGYNLGVNYYFDPHFYLHFSGTRPISPTLAADGFAPAQARLKLEVQRNLRRQRSRSYIVRTAEGGEEVVKGVLVGDVDGRQVEVHLVVIGAEQVLLANREVEQVAGCDTRRVFVVVLCSRHGDADQ